MQLKLQYCESARHTAVAAFIRGNSPDGWLKELNRWGIPVTQLECYAVPESIHSLHPAGLFVIVQAENKLRQSECFEPYGLVAGKLYLPVHAELFPAVSADELNRLLLWERQLFHPTIGLVGFSTADQLNLADLVEASPPQPTNWRLAQPGNPAKPPLQQIQMQQPTAQDVMDSFRASIDSKPLEEIPNNDHNQPSATRELLDKLLRSLLLGALWVSQQIKTLFAGNDKAKSLSPNNRKANPKHPPTPASSGPMERFQKWITENLLDLERKRNDEIKRLLTLFEENMEEALKYAIPLDSPYANRGNDTPTSQLGSRLTNFDLSQLGGGRKVDLWNLDAYQSDLRSQYLRAAQKEIEAGHFKKAAYVYAHLLGDYQSAAKVLEQGRHYREAAALYRDHLRNIPAAAECLERGGLLQEAIELFVQLHKHEKAGDLYQKMELEEKAQGHYEKSLEMVLSNGDYLDAARITHDKLAQPERAQQTLLKGWSESNQSEPCLKQYFDRMAMTNPSQMSRRVKEVFAHQTPPSKTTPFLNVLVYLNEKHRDSELLDTSRNVAYEVVGKDAEKGNVSNLHVLKKFLPEDPLIGSDCSRFVSNRHRQPQPTAASSQFQLDPGIQWLSATCHRNQFLALGLRDGHLHLARGNWYGNFEYYSWSDHVTVNDVFHLIAAPYHSNQLILHTDRGLALEDKTLPRNKYFDDELVITCPTWLAKGYAGLAINEKQEIIALKASNYLMTLHFYTMELTLKKSVDCKFEREGQFLMTKSAAQSTMIYRNGHYYTYRGNFFLQISEDGLAERVNVQSPIRRLAASGDFKELKIAISTYQGCLLLKPEPGKLAVENDFFAQDIDAVDVQFISSDLLVVAGKYRAMIYHLSESSSKAQQTFETHSPIVAVLSPSNRHQFALLEETGRITVCEIERE